jgi:hypothetical protein
MYSIKVKLCKKKPLTLESRGGKMRYCTKRLKNKLIEIVNKKITSRRIRTSAQINLTTLFYNKMN